MADGRVIGVQVLKFIGFVSLSALLLGLLAGCEKEEPPPPVPVEPVVSSPCPRGRSDDPPRARLIEAHRMFRAKKYGEARALLDQLLRDKPNSASALALRGDVTLFDDEGRYEEAARQARPFYARASALLDQGCKVQRRTEYYLRMGEAFAALRLAPGEGGTFDSAELDRAEKALEAAARRWPHSAEVHYNWARVHCARPNGLDACIARFEQALEAAESLKRPPFLRTHRSTEDWVVRSETQSEFAALRADPRYAAAIERARKKPSRPADSRHRPRLRPDPRPPTRGDLPAPP